MQATKNKKKIFLVMGTDLCEKNFAVLNICFVHPEHRRRGAASKLVEWGTNTADELGVESFVESTEDGRPLYLRHGFHVTNEFDLAPKKENPGEEWKKLDKKLRPMHGYFMWRPIRGEYEDGKTAIPWAA